VKAALGAAEVAMARQPGLPNAQRVFIDVPFENRIELIEWR